MLPVLGVCRPPVVHSLDLLGAAPIILVAGLGVPIFLAQRLADLFTGRVRAKELTMAGPRIGCEPAVSAGLNMV
jgi:hypothetical protein